MDVHVGEIVSGNTSMITIMSAGRYQIETYISELNIAQIQVSQMATATLDAYGKEVEFPARVISVDPARTIKDGVTTYKTTLEFLNTDERIRSGMTADTTITTSKKSGVFVVPNSAIILKGEERFVDVEVGNKIEVRKINIGGKSLAETEITEGLREGDMVLLNPQQ